MFLLRGADRTNLHIQTKTKIKRREEKEMITCQIMLCTTNSRGGDRWRKVGNPLQKLTQEDTPQRLHWV